MGAKSAVYIHVDWPKGDQSPRWYIDVWLAHLIAPLVADNPQLWRFHRRATRDETGHRFSVFGDANLCETIAALPRIQALVAKGLLRSVEVSHEAETNYDPSWPGDIQASWLTFAHGLSRFWLRLVQRAAQDLEPTVARLHFYAPVSDELDRLWREWAAHAVMHHANAMFGYQRYLTRS